MIALLAAAALGTEGVVLAPDFPAGRTLHGTRTEVSDPTVPPVVLQTTFEVRASDGAAFEAIHTIRTPMPVPGWALVWPELVAVTRGRIGPGLLDRDMEVTRNDLVPLFGWLLPEPDAGESLPTVDSLAFGGCGVHADRALLPAEPRLVGDHWQVGSIDCSLSRVEGDVATVDCSGVRSRSWRWWDDTETSERTLEVDLVERYVRRCGHELHIDRDVVNRQTGVVGAQQEIRISEVLDTTLGAPRHAGCMPNRTGGLCGGFAVLIAILGGTALRRRW